MSQNAITIEGLGGVRQRVRTPGKLLVLFAVALASVIALIGYATVFLIERQATSSSIEIHKSANGIRTAYYSLPEFLVDLSPDKNGRTAFLKMQLDVQFDGSSITSTKNALDEVAPVLTERLTFFLRELRPEDFSGTAEMERVKKELLRRVNLVLAPAEAQSVIIREIIIQ